MYSARDGWLSQRGLPHSDISGSQPVSGSPKLFAAVHVLLRLSSPRHPPCALRSLTVTPKARHLTTARTAKERCARRLLRRCSSTPALASHEPEACSKTLDAYQPSDPVDREGGCSLIYRLQAQRVSPAAAHRDPSRDGRRRFGRWRSLVWYCQRAGEPRADARARSRSDL